MYPGTIFNWHDQSYIRTSNAVSIDNAPLFLTASSFDKGPEDLRVVRGQVFYDLYGKDISFKKHGQPAIQAANIINAGGSLLIKRLVANDATLANTILAMTITSNIVATPVPEGEDNPDAKLLSEIKEMYASTFEVLTGDGEVDPSDVPTEDDPGESSEDTQKYTVDAKTVISWSAVSVTGVKTVQEVYDKAVELIEKVPIDIVTDDTLEEGQVKLQAKEVIPMFVVCDNGRGLSNKSIRFIPDYTTSRDSENFFYNIRIYEGTSISEKVYASANPDAVSNGNNMGISTYTSVQVVMEEVEGAYKHVVDLFKKFTGLTEDQINSSDIIYGYNNRKVGLPGVEIDPESINLNSSYGINLENGSNGSFGNAPFGTDAYKAAAAWFFYPVTEDETSESGEGVLYDYEGSDKIFDVDEYHIAACFDANYPMEVKEAISKLVTFREDFVYFRDLGLDVYNYNSIVRFAADFTIKNRFTADYATTYLIYDPLDKKRIRVTMMYDFAAAMVNHFLNGPYRPLAGTINDMVLENAIEGTINYTPRITPMVNQKDLMEQARINYAIFQSGQCVVQSLYTAQDAYTQLSYINNVLAIQQVVRAVRIACPKFRYTFVSGNDFTEYAEAVTAVLSNFLTNFSELTFEYEQDDLLASQKIFYGVIYFRFNNWAQTEVFDLYALPTVDYEES